MSDLSDWSPKIAARARAAGRAFRAPRAARSEKRMATGCSRPPRRRNAGDRFRFLWDFPPANREIFDDWIAKSIVARRSEHVRADRQGDGQDRRPPELHAHRHVQMVSSRSATSCGPDLFARRAAATGSDLICLPATSSTDLGYRRFEVEMQRPQ